MLYICGEEPNTYGVSKKAFLWASVWHNGQKRDDGVTPYIYHLLAVFDIVHQVTHDIDVLNAAVLHDVIEDTCGTYELIEENFGKRCADIVLELTHVKNKHGKWHSPNIKSKEAAMIKLADRLHNMSDMKTWSNARQKRYVLKTDFWTKNEEE
jgi:(p)ppGpp synthase/HD superfamily hydrolase